MTLSQEPKSKSAWRMGLFLKLLATSAIVALVVGVLVTWLVGRATRQEFHLFVTAIGQRQAERIAPLLASYYEFEGSFTHDGDNLETVSIRFYNVSQAAGVPVAGAQTMRAANNFGSTTVFGYDEIVAGDTVVIQYKGDASDGCV